MGVIQKYVYVVHVCIKYFLYGLTIWWINQITLKADGIKCNHHNYQAVAKVEAVLALKKIQKIKNI